MGIPVDPRDELLTPYRLDLAAMKEYKFVTTNSYAGNLVYRVLFSDGDKREVPLPQPALFSIHRRPWSRSKDDLDGQLRLLGFHGQHDEDAADADDYTVHYTGAPSSSYQEESSSSSYYGGDSSWPQWD